MSDVENRSRPQGTYRAPRATVVGKVEDVTAGHAYNYSDGTGNYQEKKSRVETPAEDEE